MENSTTYKPIIFIVDVSRSMEGEKIESLNTWIREFIPKCCDLCIGNDAIIQLAILSYSSDTKWMYNKFVDAQEFDYRDLEAYGLTNLGMALKELNKKLSFNNEGMFISSVRYYPPTIIFISDGNPTDDYEYYLGKIRKNEWFAISQKLAIAIGSEAPMDILEKLTGTCEAVCTVHNACQIINCIKVIIDD